MGGASAGAKLERMKQSRQLSYAPTNRATARRAQFTERLTGATSKTGAAPAKEIADEKQQAHQLAEHLISISPFNKRWKVIDTINEGTYGVVFSVQDIKTGTNGVIKCAKSSAENEFAKQTAEWEGFVLEKLFRGNRSASVVRLLDRGMLVDPDNMGMEFVVLEKAEINMRSYIYENNIANRRVRICEVALQSLKAVYDMHQQGLLHRDLKPDNMGICSRDQPVAMLYDLGMARMYTDSEGNLRPPRTVVHFRGTPEWASGHALKSREQTRYDDLISWFYVIIEYFDPDPNSKAPLPWSFLKNSKAIRYLKSVYCPARCLLQRCPIAFYSINTYLQTANRMRPPDYAFIAARVVEAMEECKSDKLDSNISNVTNISTTKDAQ